LSVWAGPKEEEVEEGAVTDLVAATKLMAGFCTDKRIARWVSWARTALKSRAAPQVAR
jgi:hypothetical protein